MSLQANRTTTERIDRLMGPHGCLDQSTPATLKATGHRRRRLQQKDKSKHTKSTDEVKENGGGPATKRLKRRNRVKNSGSDGGNATPAKAKGQDAALRSTDRRTVRLHCSVNLTQVTSPEMDQRCTKRESPQGRTTELDPYGDQHPQMKQQLKARRQRKEKRAPANSKTTPPNKEEVRQAHTAQKREKRGARDCRSTAVSRRRWRRCGPHVRKSTSPSHHPPPRKTTTPPHHPRTTNTSPPSCHR